MTKIETGLQSALSPAFSPDGQYLYFVAHNNAVTTGVHHGAMTLERVAWPSKGELITKVQDQDLQLAFQTSRKAVCNSIDKISAADLVHSTLSMRTVDANRRQVFSGDYVQAHMQFREDACQLLFKSCP